MKKRTINKVRELVYVASSFTTGLTDLVITVRKPDGSSFTPTPTFTEQGDGVYVLSYTPETLGNWQEKISSATNGDYLINSYEVVAYDETDIQSQVAGVETKVDTIDTNVDSVKSTVETTDGKVDTVSTNVNSANTKLDTINGKIDGIASNVGSGGYIA